MRCDELFSIFPEWVQKMLADMKFQMDGLQEIRLRTGRKLLVICKGKEYWSDRSLSGKQIREVLSYLSGYSMYAYEEEVRQGFLTLPGGHRVGLAGRTILDGTGIRTMTEISSLNIRFAHEVKGCADPVCPYLWKEEQLLPALFISPPGCGKTTLLRDCIRQISEGCCGHAGMTVGVVDERSEIAGNDRGIPGNDLGSRTDVLDGCPKAEGMMLLIRSMAPKVVAVDEVGSQKDLEALKFAAGCGCVLLATVHGEDMGDLMAKPILRAMVEEQMFERYVFLEKGRCPGRIRKILDQDGKPVMSGGTGCLSGSEYAV